MKKSFLPLSVLALLALAACGGNNPFSGSSSHPTGLSTPAATSQPATTSEAATSQPATTSEAATSQPATTSEAATSSEEVEYGVAIANKEILEEDWYLGDEDRRLSITLSPAANVQAALASGELVITSDNPETISVTQLMIHAGAIGDAHITVTYHGKSDSIYLHVNEAIHGTKIDDPLTPAEAIAIGQGMSAGQTTASTFYIKGYVTAIADPYSAAYSNVTFYLGPSADSTQADSFYLYRIGATAELGAAIIKGAEVMVKCPITNYNGTPENSNGTVISAEGGSAQVRPTGHGWEENDPFTVAEALERCGGLAANIADEFDCYVKGTVTEIEAKSDGKATFYIVDAVGGSAFYVYQLTAGAEDAAKILKGAEVVVNVTLKKYKSTSDPSKPEVLETAAGGKLISAEGGSSYVPKTGHGWEEGDPFSVEEALAQEPNPEQALFVKGYVVGIPTAYSEQYGNITILLADDATETDAAKELSCFRVKVSKEQADALVLGAQVELTGKIAAKSGGGLELSAGGTVVGEITPPAVVPTAKTTIAEITADGQDVEIAKATVIAVNTKAIVIDDGTGSIYAYINAAPTVAVGDVVSVTGKSGNYKAVVQINNPVITKLEGESPAIPNPTVLTKEVADEFPNKKGYGVGEVYTWDTKVVNEGGYFYVPFEGSETKIELINPASGAVADGGEYTVTGYFLGYDSRGWAAIVLISAEAKGDVPPAPTAKTTIAELTKDGQEVDIAEATVIAVNTKAIVIDDGTGSIYAYINAAPTVQVGDVVSVKGTTGNYKDVVQINNPVVTKLEGKSPSIPDPTVLTKEVADEFPNKKGYGVGEVYTWTTRVSEDGGYFYTPFEGSETKIELINPAAGAVTKDLKYNITGYFLGYDSRGWAGFVLISAEEVKEPRVEVSVDKETIAVGEKAQLTIDMINFPEDGDHTTNVSITTEDESILEIDEIMGTVTGLAEGTGTVAVVVTLDNDVFEQDIEIEVTAANVRKVEFNFANNPVSWAQGGKDDVVQKDGFGYTFNIINAKTNTGYFFLNSGDNKGKSLIANATPVPGAITKIEVYGRSGSSGTAQYVLDYGDTAFTAPLTLGTDDEPTHIGQGDWSVEIGAEHDIRYFGISVVNSKNGQITRIVITFVPDAEPVPNEQ